jgi:hypothetical protein
MPLRVQEAFTGGDLPPRAERGAGDSSAQYQGPVPAHLLPRSSTPALASVREEGSNIAPRPTPPAKPKRPGRWLPEEKRERLEDELQAGASIKQAARLAGVTPRTARRYAGRMGARPATPERPAKPPPKVASPPSPLPKAAKVGAPRAPGPRPPCPRCGMEEPTKLGTRGGKLRWRCAACGCSWQEGGLAEPAARQVAKPGMRPTAVESAAMSTPVGGKDVSRHRWPAATEEQVCARCGIRRRPARNTSYRNPPDCEYSTDGGETWGGRPACPPHATPPLRSGGQVSLTVTGIRPTAQLDEYEREKQR